LENLWSAGPANFEIKKSLSYQSRRKAMTKLFQIFIGPFWAIPTA
jgi:hypothetical protein